jgi:hypothetical protein
MLVRLPAPMRSFVPAACALVLSGCVVVTVPKPNSTVSAQPTATSTASLGPADPSSLFTSSDPTGTRGGGSATPQLVAQRAITLTGETQVWNGQTSSYQTVQHFRRDAQLFMITKAIGGGTAFAIQSGQLLEERAGVILYATNTAALQDIPAINRTLVTASIDVAGLDVDDPAAGKFHATVDPVMSRAVTVLSFQIRNGSNYPPKQILAGTVRLEVAGDAVTGQMALEGADLVGGARPLNRYLATISSS